MKTRGSFFMVFGLALTAGCAPPTVPNRPSWDEDVFPILQGSCNHCHGETVGRIPNFPLGRLDVCANKPFVDAGIVVPFLVGAQVEAALFPLNLKPQGDSTRATMPPPPAAELSDYERDVLLKWGMSGDMDKCAKQGRNRPPDMRLTGDPVWDGDDLKLPVDVWDLDKDQVVGKVTVGMGTAIIPASGRREIVVGGATRGERITILLHDGYDSRPFEF